MKRKLFYISICLLIIFAIVQYKARGNKSQGHPLIDVDVLIENKEIKGEYTTLGDQVLLMGEIKGATRPNASEDKYAYVEYKLNDSYYATAYSPSYDLTIDTTKLPDGWNKLLIIGYEEADKVKGIKQIIFKVENKNNIKPRAKRQGKDYEVGRNPSYKKNYIPVLMYHDFQKDIMPERESGVVHPELFEKQLQVLLENEYTPITFKDLYAYMNGVGGLPAKPVIITADDGYLSNYDTAFPILKKYNIPATYFITTRYLGTTTMYPHFTWKQGREMEESGLIDIQSHTHSHMLMSKLPKEQVLYETSVSFGIIEQNLGERDVRVLAYPQFYHNRQTRKWLREDGVHLQVTNLASKYSYKTTPMDIKRIHVGNFTTPQGLIEEIEKITGR